MKKERCKHHARCDGREINKICSKKLNCYKSENTKESTDKVAKNRR